MLFRSLEIDGDPKKKVIRQVFEDANNYMKSGTLMLGVIEKLEDAINFHDFKTRQHLGDIYEKILNDLRSAGNAGEFYTPRAITQFMVNRVDPRLDKRETILDPACGTGGFLTATIEHLRGQLTKKSGAEDRAAIETAIAGIEKKHRRNSSGGKRFVKYIDLENETPDPEWLRKSDELTRRLIELHEAGDIPARNKLIDDNARHWGQIKNWLLRLSHHKCWFSEAKEIYSHLDVEHFRPKKEAKDLNGNTRDGYWWLAFDYRNYRICGNVGNRKKGGWFPLQENSLLSTYDKPCEESETPYLLDPTDPVDVTLIAFDEEGNARPAPDISDWEKERVEVTIDRLKLNAHDILPAERRKIWTMMSREIDQFLRFSGRCAKGGNPAARERACEHARRIREMTREDAELSSVAKWCLQLRNDPRVLRLAA